MSSTHTPTAHTQSTHLAVTCSSPHTGSGGSPAPTVTPKRDKTRSLERDLPHPLADNAAIEGVPVQMIESRGSSNDLTPSINAPSPKARKAPPPVAPYKPVPLSSQPGKPNANPDPPSPIPKPRQGTAANQNLNITRTSSADTPTENGESRYGVL